jgi:hypothetical protein
MWMGTLNEKGYARMGFGGQKKRFVHRLSYEEYTGRKIDKPEIDHLCRHPWCVNPSHLEPVTRSENQKRSPLNRRGVRKFQFCRRGHSLTADNVYRMKNGKDEDGCQLFDRVCRICILTRQRERYERIKRERSQT